MKKLIILFLILLNVEVFAQSYTEKYNSYLGRYEYFNKSNVLIGYKKYDSRTNTWKYYDVEKENRENDVNYTDIAEMSGKVQGTLQARYDQNYQRLIKALKEMNDNVVNSNLSSEVKSRVLAAFNDKVREIDSKKSLNLSDNTSTTSVINYLISNINYFTKLYINEEISTNKAILNTGSKNNGFDKLNQETLAKLNGNYISNKVTEYRYNYTKKDYEEVREYSQVTNISFNADKALLCWSKLGMTNSNCLKLKYDIQDNTDPQMIYFQYTFKTEDSNTKVEMGIPYFSHLFIYKEKVGNIYQKKTMFYYPKDVE